jgi:hypothetical protein
MSANPYARDLRKVSDPLREETRKVRKTLLIWCLAAIAITLGRLFPSEISALGMKVTATSHAVLLGLMAAVVAYHLVAFVIYAAADFVHWYIDHMSTEWEDDVANYETYKAELLAKAKLSEEDREFMEEHERRLRSHWRSEPVRIYMRVQAVVPYISLARALVEFLFPLLVGSAGLYLLIVGSRNAL